ncbi:MAG: hypothetical protein QXS23_03225 [Desulfurococcaceae archaeon]
MNIRIYSSTSNIYEKGKRLWYMESSLYNYSINISIGIVNALVIKILGYGVVELGLLTFLRLLAMALSQFPAVYLTMFHRDKRKWVWFILGSVNRVGWALMIISIFLPRGIDLVYIFTLTFIAQFTGGIAGVAASDTIGDLIQPSMSTVVFARVNQFNYMATAMSYVTTVLVFISPFDSVTRYIIAYMVALSAAMASAIILYFIPDPEITDSPRVMGVRNGDVVLFKDIIAEKRLRNYLTVISMFNFAVNIPAAFWDYIVLNVTNGMEVFIVLKNIVNLGIKFTGMKWWQRYVMKIGVKKAFVRGLAFTSLIPIAYIEVISPIEIIGIEVYSGFTWIPVDLGSMIYNIYLPPSSARPVYVSTINLATNLVSSIASYVGTSIAMSTGSVIPVLIASGVLRGVTAGIASRILPEINKEK